VNFTCFSIGGLFFFVVAERGYQITYSWLHGPQSYIYLTLYLLVNHFSIFEG
jgi:hypothetical protein